MLINVELSEVNNSVHLARKVPGIFILLSEKYTFRNTHASLGKFIVLKECLFTNIMFLDITHHPVDLYIHSPTRLHGIVFN
jgi:hypothetical protein